MDDLDAVAAGKMEAGKCHTADEPWQHRRFVRFGPVTEDRKALHFLVISRDAKSLG
jgi:hypothetical protein